MSPLSIFEVLLAAVCFLFCITNYLTKRDGLPIDLPIAGMLPELLLNIHWIQDWLTEALRSRHCTFLLKGGWFSNLNMLITSDPANINYVLNSNFSNFTKGSDFNEYFDILGGGIFNSDLDSWRHQRKVAHLLMKCQPFHQFSVGSIHAKVAKGLMPLLDHVSSQSLVVDLQDIFQRFTFDATCILTTGYDPGCLSPEFPEVQFSKAVDEAEEAIFYRHIKPKRFLKLQQGLNVGQEKKHKQAWKIIDQTLAKYICKKKETVLQKRGSTNHEEESVDLLTSYLTLTDDQKVLGSSTLEPDDKFLRDTILTFMLAGRDTNSAALTWYFWLVSKNPQVETKIIEELKSIVPPEETDKYRLFDAEELKNLVYLHGSLCEALRLYPPVPFQHKVPLQGDTLPSGHTVNPDVKIVFSLYAMARMEWIWGEDCLEFKPERWVSDKGGIKHEPSYKFASFGAGPRACLGKEVSLTEMKAVASAIIYNYRVCVVAEHPVVPRTSIVLQMKHGLKIKVSSRWA